MAKTELISHAAMVSNPPVLYSVFGAFSVLCMKTVIVEFPSLLHRLCGRVIDVYADSHAPGTVLSVQICEAALWDRAPSAQRGGREGARESSDSLRGF